jgi:hypothetical protein
MLMIEVVESTSIRVICVVEDLRLASSALAPRLLPHVMGTAESETEPVDQTSFIQ